MCQANFETATWVTSAVVAMPPSTRRGGLLAVSVARESGSERLLIAAVVGRVPCSRSGRGCRRAPQWRQDFLNFLPLPHGQGSFRPTPLNGSTDDGGVSA